MIGTSPPSRFQIALGVVIYSLLFGAMGVALVMAAQEYPEPPASLQSRQ